MNFKLMESYLAVSVTDYNDILGPSAIDGPLQKASDPETMVVHLVVHCVARGTKLISLMSLCFPNGSPVRLSFPNRNLFKVVKLSFPSRNPFMVVRLVSRIDESLTLSTTSTNDTTNLKQD
jgi:hypothetical protein